MVNYNKSIIYKICCKDINIKEIYVGSTANELRKRKNHHKYDCNNINRKAYNLYVYQFIRNNGGFDNWDIIEVERCNCNDKQELHKRERFYIELLGASLNCLIPTRSENEKKEYTKEKNKKHYESNKDKIKKNYENNKDKILEKNKKYYESHKDKIAEKDKERYEKNRDKILEKNKERYDKIKDKLKEKVECDICNKIMNRGCLTRHKKNIHNK